MDKSAAKGEGTENDGTPLDVLASVATVCLVQSRNFSGHRRCEQCGSVSNGELVHSLAVKPSADLKDCEKSFHESESLADYQLLGCSKSTSVKASGSGNTDGEKKMNLHLIIKYDSEDGSNTNQKEALHPEDDWNAMIESVHSNINLTHNDICENGYKTTARNGMVSSKKRSNDDDVIPPDDDTDWFAIING
jgi:hypothetical protein